MFFKNQRHHFFLGIDFLKFFVIVSMQLFLTLNWALANIRPQDLGNHWSLQLFNLPFIPLSGSVLLLIPAMAGFTFRKALSIKRNQIKSSYRSVIFLSIILFLASFIKNMFIANDSLITWDIFTLLILTYITIFIIGKLNIYLLLALIIVSFINSMGILTFLSTGPRWPFFPWSGMSTIGFFLCHFYLQTTKKLQFKLITLLIAIIFLLISGPQLISHLSNSYNQYLQTNYFTPSLSLLFFYISFYLFATIGASFLSPMLISSQNNIILNYSHGILPIMILSPLVGNLFFKLLAFIPIPLWSLVIIHVLNMLGLSWLLGALSKKYLHQKSYHFKFRRLT